MQQAQHGKTLLIVALAVLAVVVLLWVILPLFGVATMAGMMGGSGSHGMMGEVGTRMWLAVALGGLALPALVGAVVFGVMWLARSSDGVQGRAGNAQTPQEILRRRYAAGEITREEYEHMGRILE